MGLLGLVQAVCISTACQHVTNASLLLNSGFNAPNHITPYQ